LKTCSEIIYAFDLGESSSALLLDLRFELRYYSRKLEGLLCDFRRMHSKTVMILRCKIQSLTYVVRVNKIFMLFYALV
jgi:hypothetical protein